MRRKLLMVAAALTLLLTVPYASWRLYDNDAYGLVVARDSKLFIGERTFTFLGANSFELWRYSLKQITEILDIAHQHDLRVIRVFLGGTAFEKPLGTYNEWNLKKLDYILAYCRLKGMYVIITLRDNNWIEDVYWNENGTTNKTRMYTVPELVEAYKEFIGVVLNRVNAYNYKTYRNDPTIMAWDICNEPDITVGSPSLEAYVKEVSDYVRKVDSRHLVTVGLCNKSNIELVEDFVDFNSVHSYPDEEGQIENITSLDKPAILGEFGVNKTCLLDEAAIYDAYLDAASTNNMSGAMFWNLGLGHNPWDRWINEDAHIFTLFKNNSETWCTDTYSASSVDRLFFLTGSSVQVLVKHSAYVTIGIITVATLVGAVLFIQKKVKKGAEIPQKFET